MKDQISLEMSPNCSVNQTEISYIERDNDINCGFIDIDSDIDDTDSDSDYGTDEAQTESDYVSSDEGLVSDSELDNAFLDNDFCAMDEAFMDFDPETSHSIDNTTFIISASKLETTSFKSRIPIRIKTFSNYKPCQKRQVVATSASKIPIRRKPVIEKPNKKVIVIRTTKLVEARKKKLATRCHYMKSVWKY